MRNGWASTLKAPARIFWRTRPAAVLQDLPAELERDGGTPVHATGVPIAGGISADYRELFADTVWDRW